MWVLNERQSRSTVGFYNNLIPTSNTHEDHKKWRGVPPATHQNTKEGWETTIQQTQSSHNSPQFNPGMSFVESSRWSKVLTKQPEVASLLIYPLLRSRLWKIRCCILHNTKHLHNPVELQHNLMFHTKKIRVCNRETV